MTAWPVWVSGTRCAGTGVNHACGDDPGEGPPVRAEFGDSVENRCVGLTDRIVGVCRTVLAHLRENETRRLR